MNFNRMFYRFRHLGVGVGVGVGASLVGYKYMIQPPKTEIKKVVLSDRVEWINYKNELHRKDGPAIEDADGYKAWYAYACYHSLNYSFPLLRSVTLVVPR